MMQTDHSPEIFDSGSNVLFLYIGREEYVSKRRSGTTDLLVNYKTYGSIWYLPRPRYWRVMNWREKESKGISSKMGGWRLITICLSLY